MPNPVTIFLIVKRAVITGFLLLSITACTIIPKPDIGTIDSLWDQRRQNLTAKADWDIRGRIAIYVDGKAETASFRWQRDNDIMKIIINAPFGQGALLIESKMDDNLGLIYQLTLPDNKTYLGKTPESLLSQRFGWEIPVNGLNQWVKGVPIESEPFDVIFNDYGYPKSIIQRDWKINYLDYDTLTNPTTELPERLYLKHERLAIKLSIERWHSKVVEVDDSKIEFPGLSE